MLEARYPVRGGHVARFMSEDAATGKLQHGVKIIHPSSPTDLILRSRSKALLMSWVDILSLAVLDSRSVRSFTTAEREALPATLELISDTATAEPIS